MINRRQAVAVLAATGLVEAGLVGSPKSETADHWFSITGDDGNPVPNMRLPVELIQEVDELPGAIWTGSESREVTIIEFFDYNCPYCRKAMADLQALAGEMPDLRVGLVNNAILSAESEQAARVELAVLKLGGQVGAYEFHRGLFARRGVIEREKALDVAESLGAPRIEVATLAASDEIEATLSAQMRLAASLGMATTPSFIIAGTGLFGYPGRASLERIVAAVRDCDRIAC